MLCNFLRCKDGKNQPTYNTGKNINLLDFLLISQKYMNNRRREMYVNVKTPLYMYKKKIQNFKVNSERGSP